MINRKSLRVPARQSPCQHRRRRHIASATISKAQAACRRDATHRVGREGDTRMAMRTKGWLLAGAGAAAFGLTALPAGEAQALFVKGTVNGSFSGMTVLDTFVDTSVGSCGSEIKNVCNDTSSIATYPGTQVSNSFGGASTPPRSRTSIAGATPRSRRRSRIWSRRAAGRGWRRRWGW